MVMNILQVVEIERGINMNKLMEFNWSGFMRICKVIMTLCVFVISSIQLSYTGDLLWQCVWSLSLIKLVELSDE